jgi:hypothetical protein
LEQPKAGAVELFELRSTTILVGAPAIRPLGNRILPHGD